MSAVVVRDLVRDYASRAGTRRALDGVGFTVEQGTVVGLLGPNGAGKTTCIRILTTLLLPTSGTALVAGADVVRSPRQVQRRVGVSFGGDTGLYTRLSGRDNLRYFGTMYGMSGRPLAAAADRLLDRVGLLDRAADRVETYSRGMRQRLHIARALLHDPSVVLLDEPTSGLDPAHARDVRTLVTDVCAEGRAVLVATHDMVEAEQLCRQVVILRGGQVVKGATVEAVRRDAARVAGQRVELVSRVPVPRPVLAGVPGVLRYSTAEDGGVQTVTVATHEPAAAVAHLVGHLGENVLSLTVTQPTLEEAYLASVT
jgi:ABC-2 type transport system ATP-binding protein